MDNRPSYPGPPRWVKVLGIVAVVAVLLLVAIMVVAGGEHGPGRHVGSSAIVDRATLGGGGWS